MMIPPALAWLAVFASAFSPYTVLGSTALYYQGVLIFDCHSGALPNPIKYHVGWGIVRSARGGHMCGVHLHAHTDQTMQIAVPHGVHAVVSACCVMLTRQRAHTVQTAVLHRVHAVHAVNSVLLHTA